jgi:hypothetical protein
VHIRRDAEQAGREVIKFLWADEEVRPCALEALLVSLLVAKASKRCQTLHVSLTSLQSLHACIRMEDRVVTNKPAPEMRYGGGGLPAYGLHHENPYPPRQAEANRRQSRHQ